MGQKENIKLIVEIHSGGWEVEKGIVNEVESENPRYLAILF